MVPWIPHLVMFELITKKEMVPSWEMEGGDVKKGLLKLDPKRGMWCLTRKTGKSKSLGGDKFLLNWLTLSGGWLYEWSGGRYTYIFVLFQLNIEINEILSSFLYGVLYVRISVMFSISYACLKLHYVMHVMKGHYCMKRGIIFIKLHVSHVVVPLDMVNVHLTSWDN